METNGLIQDISSYLPVKFVFFLKKDYFLTYSIVSVCLQTNISDISGAHNSKSKCCYNAKPSAYYFYLKTKISASSEVVSSEDVLDLKQS